MTSLLDKLENLFRSPVENQSPKKSYRSVREFLLEIFKTSSNTLKTTSLILVVISLPIAVYLATSPNSPLQRSNATGYPTPSPTSLFQTASPSATPSRPLK